MGMKFDLEIAFDLRAMRPHSSLSPICNFVQVAGDAIVSPHVVGRDAARKEMGGRCHYGLNG
jgi:hypothetical protein